MIVMDYYLEKECLHQIYKDSSYDIDQIMIVLTYALNGLHSVDHSERYWSILLRLWVRIITENFHHCGKINNNSLMEQPHKIQFNVAPDYDVFSE